MLTTFTGFIILNELVLKVGSNKIVYCYNYKYICKRKCIFLYTKKMCVNKQMQRLNISKNVVDLFKNPIKKLLAKYKRKEKDPDDEE